MKYATSKTCSREIDFEVENNKTLEGINCGNRGTSCPDQLAQALKAYKANHQA